MEYYYGQAWIKGKTTDIRVKPEMIKDEIVEEIDLYLPVKVSGGKHTIGIKSVANKPPGMP